MTQRTVSSKFSSQTHSQYKRIERASPIQRRDSLLRIAQWTRVTCTFTPCFAEGQIPGVLLKQNLATIPSGVTWTTTGTATRVSAVLYCLQIAVVYEITIEPHANNYSFIHDKAMGICLARVKMIMQLKKSSE